MTTISPSARVYPNVLFGDGAIVGDFAIIGEPPRGSPPGEHPTVIGPGAVIRSHTVIYAGNRIGKGFQAGHGVLIREFNEIGDDVSIGTHSIVEHHVRMASGVRVHSNVFIPEYSELDECCWVGPNVVFTNARFPRSEGAKASLRGPRIRTRARIGANATLLPGVEIGAEALIGAGTVVVKDVPAGAVVVGNPARVLKHVSDIDAYREKRQTS